MREESTHDLSSDSNSFLCSFITEAGVGVGQWRRNWVQLMRSTGPVERLIVKLQFILCWWQLKKQFWTPDLRLLAGSFPEKTSQKLGSGDLCLSDVTLDDVLLYVDKLTPRDSLIFRCGLTVCGSVLVKPAPSAAKEGLLRNGNYHVNHSSIQKKT